MLKMARIYLDLEIIEGAKLMYESVLEQDPENQAALQFFSTLDETK